MARFDYESEESWNNFFSEISKLGSSASPAHRMAESLREEWDGKPVAEILDRYEEFFHPEIVESEEGREERVRPWFLKFFGIGFTQGVEYEGLVYRYEQGKSLEKIKVDVSSSDRSPTFFRNIWRADDVCEAAEEKGFEFERAEEDVSITAPEDIRGKLVEEFERAYNLSPISHPATRFVWSLSNGPLEDYAKEAYPGLDDSLLDKLGLEIDRNFDVVYAPSYERDSPASMLMELIGNLCNAFTGSSTVSEPFASSEARSILGIENSPEEVLNKYFDDVVADLKEKISNRGREVIQKILDSIAGYAGEESYFRGQGYNKISELPDFAGTETSKLEVLEVCSPFLFSGILRYSPSYKSIEGWKRLRNRW